LIDSLLAPQISFFLFFIARGVLEKAPRLRRRTDRRQVEPPENGGLEAGSDRSFRRISDPGLVRDRDWRGDLSSTSLDLLLRGRIPPESLLRGSLKKRLWRVQERSVSSWLPPQLETKRRARGG